MPTYEMPLLLRVMTKPETKSALKRVSHRIFNTGGFIRKIDNLGEQETPYKMSSHDKVHRKAGYFIIHFDAPPRKIDDLLEECGRDVDIIRNRAYKKYIEQSPPCTFHEEMLPVPYRPEVQKLIEMSKKVKVGYTHVFKYNSGFDHYPFQK